jgi:hypothetical protein
MGSSRSAQAGGAVVNTGFGPGRALERQDLRHVVVSGVLLFVPMPSYASEGEGPV